MGEEEEKMEGWDGGGWGGGDGDGCRDGEEVEYYRLFGVGREGA